MKRPLHSLLTPAALGALAFLAAAGCKRDEVTVYTVDTNQTATAAAPAPDPSAPPQAAPPSMSAMPATMPPGLPTPDNSSLPQLKYTLPEGWQEKSPSQMRVASFDITQNGKAVDVSVVPLGGMGGGDFANVNRWRGQVGLPATDDNAIQQSAQNVTVGSQPASLYDIGGNGAQRIIATILHRGDTVWFFKMDGDTDLTESNKAAFISFLQSVQFADNSAPASVPAMDASQLPPSHPPIGDTSAVSSDISTAKPTWTVPADWQTGPVEQFLVAKFVIGTGDATADVNVSSLSGDGGGVGPNVNRWRGQIGLTPEDNPATTSLDVLGGKAQVVDLSGTDAKTGQPARLIGVIVPIGSQTWFYKLMGNPDVVSRQKDAFTGFVQLAKYPDAH